MANRSPFPGMDPWLEAFWGPVHHTYMQAVRDQLAGQLPDGLFSEVEETVYILDFGEDAGRVRPDVAVFSHPDAGDEQQDEHDLPPFGGVAVATPVRIRIAEEPLAVTHVVIRSLARHEPLVTAIELISPTNKLDPRSRKVYRRKRGAYYDAGANVVEIDLLRAGRPLIDVPWDRVELGLRTPYRATVRRAVMADIPDIEAEYYPMPLHDRLPVIRIPLRPGERDVALDLQTPLEHAYEKGSYHRRIDYSRPPDPPLSPEDAAWAAERVAAGRDSG
jgi:hypothetical protein